MNRRDFLKGAGSAIIPAAIPAAFSGWRSPAIAVTPALNLSPRLSPITAVVYDERYSDCKIFAETLLRRGATLFPTHGDSAALWYGFLRPHLARTGGRVAGFTTDADFVVSQACGRELHLRLAYEGVHDGRASTGITHRIHSSANEREIAAALLREDAPWSASLAEVLSGMPSAISSVGRGASAARLSARISLAATAPRSADHPGYLTSWLLTPAAPPHSSSSSCLV